MNEKWNKFKNLLKDSGGLSTIGSANLVGGLISAFFWFLVAGLLGTEDYGEVSYYFAIANLAFTISYLGAGHSIIVYTSKENKKQSSVYFVTLISTVITSTVLFLIFSKAEISLYVIGAVIFGLAISELLGFKLYKNYFKYMITQRILLIVFGLGLYYVIGTDGIILGISLSFFPFLIRIFKSFKEEKIDIKLIKLRKNFILHSYLLDVSRNFPLFSDKLIILPLFGFTLLGNYQLGIQVIIFLGILPQTIYQFILPKESKGEQVLRLKIMAVLVSICFAVLTLFLAPHIFPILFPEFVEAVQIIQIMSFAIIPITINYMYISKFLASEQSKIVMIGSTIYLTVQITGIIILGNTYGVNGAAIALILGASAQSIWYFVSKNISQIVR